VRFPRRVLRHKTGFVVIALFVSVVLSGCGQETCRSPSECPLGFYCEFLAKDGATAGQCIQDCRTPADCPQPDPGRARAVCTNEGRCETRPFPPTLVVFEPEQDTSYDEGVFAIRISGEVGTSESRVTVSARPSTDLGCVGGFEQSVSLKNPEPGVFRTLPFLIEPVFVDSGNSEIAVAAEVEGALDQRLVYIDAACPGCATIDIQSPLIQAAVQELELPLLSGTVSPQVSLSAVWRVRNVFGDVFDGLLAVKQGVFQLDRIPLFAGRNQVEVTISGVGDGLGESRCSTSITSAVLSESGLRMILTWDTEDTDLDTHIVGPAGRFLDPGGDLSARTQNPAFGGAVQDDVDGLGPETAIVSSPPDGVYGLIVEPVIDGPAFGSSGLVRLLFGGRNVRIAPIGPRFVSANRGEVWVLGTVSVLAGSAEFVSIDRVVPFSEVPNEVPSQWSRILSP
jgi:hypothetical protein